MRILKRTTAVILSALLLISLFTVAGYAAEGKLTVNLKSNVADAKTVTYDLAKSSTFTASFNVKAADKIINTQGYMTYDRDCITLTGFELKKVGSAIINKNQINRVDFNSSDIAGADFTKGGDLVVATFKIVKAGSTDINLDFDIITATKNDKDVEIVSDGKVVDTSAALKGALSTTASSSKKANPMTVKVAKKSIKAKTLKKKNVTVKAITVKKAKGTVKYVKVKKGTTKKYYKKITVNSKTGKIKFKKGKYKKGTVKVVVKITAKGNSSYKSKTVTKSVKIKIK